MHSLAISIALFTPLLLASIALAEQTAAEPETTTSICTLEDESQIMVRYRKADAKTNLPFGKVWGPGDAPLTLFTQAPVKIGNVEFPLGAYSMYFIPGKQDWTLVVNKNVTAGSSYDDKQDLVRTRMETLKLDNAADLNIALGHTGPKQCEMRLYYSKTAAWTTIAAK